MTIKANFRLPAIMASLFVAWGLTACGGSSTPPLQGVFLDSAVIGASYTGDKGSQGVTNSTGTFNYQPGEKVTFSIGQMTLGTAIGDAVVTPVSFEAAQAGVGDHAKRVLRTLQTLDSDGDPTNGINISDSTRTALTTKLALAIAADTDVEKAIGKTLKNEAEALEHFSDTLVKNKVNLQDKQVPVTLTLMHTNDTHSHMESFTDTVLQGGVARRKTLIDQVKSQIDTDKTCKNQLLVDAGDFSQGTPYYNAWEGSESVMAMNAMGYDVSTLGNHEFDLGPARLARVLSGSNITVAGLDKPTESPAFKVVASNLDISGESSLKGLIKKFAVVERCGEKYGVIGVVTEDLPLIASAGNVKVQDYVTSVNATAAKLKAMGINKIILLSHYGYDVDVKKAPELSGVSIIVSGHDHTLLGAADYINQETSSATTTPAYTGQGALSKGDYPKQLKNKDGDKILVVSAFEWGRWLGRLEVSFDANGKILTGINKSAFVSGTLVEDAALKQKVADYYAPVKAQNDIAIGTSAMAFSSARGTASPFVAGVRSGETLLGNLVSDLMQGAAKASDSAVASFTNGGGLRADIPSGTVTFGQALSVLPFGNTLYAMDLTGQDVIDLMEAGVSKVGGGGFLQHSKELRMKYCADLAACSGTPLKTGGRVISVEIAGQPVSIPKIYRFATNNFTAGGGDGYTVLKNACQRTGNYCRDSGIVQLDLLVNALKSGTPLTATLDGRITRQ